MNRTQGIGRVRATADTEKEVPDNTAEGVSGFGGECGSIEIRRGENVEIRYQFSDGLQTIMKDTIEGRGV